MTSLSSFRCRYQSCLVVAWRLLKDGAVPFLLRITQAISCHNISHSNINIVYIYLCCLDKRNTKCCVFSNEACLGHIPSRFFKLTEKNCWQQLFPIVGHRVLWLLLHEFDALHSLSIFFIKHTGIFLNL